MIKLDKYESQIMLLSKFHYDKKMKELGLSKFDVLKALWVKRCALPLRFVKLHTIASSLVKLVSDKLLILKNGDDFSDLFFEAYDLTQGRGKGLAPVEPMSISEALITVCLYKLSTLQVQETVNGEVVVLVEYKDYDDSFLDIYRGEK